MKTRVRYRCAACGRGSLRWEGRCPGCGAWNAVEKASAEADGGGRKPRAGPRGRPTSLAREEEAAPARVRADLGDLDLVLGGGLVSGSLVLLGGPPGVGKSTLLLQLAAGLGAVGERTLYASGEESGEQVRLRARRIGGDREEVLFLAETEVEAVVEAAREVAPALLCVDSIQTLRTSELSSGAGTVNQVRECAAALQAWAKASGTPTVLVGHVTKEGALAGPRTLEHLVDVVLHLEGPRGSEHRILRAAKNRFGSVGEVAVFRMRERGLEAVEDPATAFLADRPRGTSGSAVAVSLEGTRPLLAEVQALTAPSRYGSPRRMTTGFPARRLAMLLAVLERRAGLPCGEDDVFVNVVGGLRLSDPAADLAVLAALASARLDRPLPPDWAFVGEVGLGGEVRPGGAPERRLRAVARAGLTGAFVSTGAAGAWVSTGADGAPDGLRVRGVEHARELASLVREASPEASGGGP